MLTGLKKTKIMSPKTTTTKPKNPDSNSEIKNSKNENRDKENELIILGVPIYQNESLTQIIDSTLEAINASSLKTAVTSKFRYPYSKGIVFRLTNKTIRDEILKLARARKTKIKASELNENFSNSTNITIKIHSRTLSKLTTLKRKVMQWKNETKSIQSVYISHGAVILKKWNGVAIRLENLKDFEDFKRTEEKETQDFHNYFTQNFKIYHTQNSEIENNFFKNLSKG